MDENEIFHDTFQEAWELEKLSQTSPCHIQKQNSIINNEQILNVNCRSRSSNPKEKALTAIDSQSNM